jgi:putative sigma-54 modulation protein
METIITGRHCTVDSSAKDYVNEKLTNVFSHKTLKISTVRVIVTLEKQTRYKVEIIANLKKFDIEAVSESYDMYESIDAAMTRLNKQVKKYVDKKQDHQKRPSMRETVKAIDLQMNRVPQEEEEDGEKEE